MIKSLFKKLLPSVLHPSKITLKVLEHILSDRKIKSGPFAGLNYTTTSVGSEYLPKILGIYELELHETLLNFIDCDPKTILIVGAAEGYYAVGLAARCTNASVIAFETQDTGRQLIKENCLLNNIKSNLTISGHCSVKEFNAIAKSINPDLIIIDIEGGESDMITLSSIEALSKSKLIIELHPWVEKHIKQNLIDLLKSTHTCTVIKSRPRTQNDLPFSMILKILIGRWIIPLTSECRPELMEWLIAEPI